MAVVEFRKKEPEHLVYRCNCGCLTHYHHADGNVECAGCGAYASITDGGWRLNTPPTPSDPQASDGSDTKVVDLGQSSSAISRVAGKANPDATAAIIVIQLDSLVSVWCHADIGAEEEGWMRLRFDDAMDLMRKKRS